MDRRFRSLPFLLCALLLAACAPAPRGPALWRLSDADSTVYLFGTVHVLPPALNWRSARVDAAFADAETIVFEADVENPTPAFAAMVREKGLLPAGRTLSSMLTPETRALLTRVALQSGVDAAALEPTRPWWAALQISVNYAIAAGGDPAAGVERVLSAEARAAGKPMRFLETPEAQIRALADLSPAAEMRFLETTLAQIAEGRADTDALDQAWASGDVAALARIANEDIAEAGPEAYEALLTARNRAWADQIVRMLEGSDDVFVAVGAAHLVGNDSVIALLRARGLPVEGP